MKSEDMWKGLVGASLIAAFLGIIGGIAYLLYGPPIHINFPAGFSAPKSAIATSSILDSADGFLFTCDGGESLKAAFSDGSVRLALSDGRGLSLPRAISADGARYANPNESFVFWNVGDTAFIQENGAETYSGCITAGQ